MSQSVQEPSLIKRQPVRVSTLVVSLIQLCVLGGLFTISQQNTVMVGAAVETLVYAAMPTFLLASNWLKGEWQARRVSAPATAEPIAEALLGVEKARMKNTAPYTIPLKAVRAAERVLGETETTPETRWIGDVEP